MTVSTHGDSAEVNRKNTKKNQISEMLSTTVAVACILSVGVSIANAEDNITLPPVEVETTEEQDADAARKKVIAAEAQRRRRAEIAQQAKRSRRAAAAAAQAKRNRQAAAIRAAQRKRAAVAKARAAAEARARAEEEARIAAAEAAAKAKEVARGNPHADPDAHFKSDTLANSRLPGKVVDTPRTVTTIGKELLEKTSTTSVREIARTTPGVSLGFGEGGNQYGDNIYIRGFKANNDIYVDGVRDTGISVRDSFNTEQVEVVKGPAGTVGGRGTTGGALDIVTKKAKDVSFYEVNAEITSVGTKRVTTDLNHAFNENFQFRFNGLFQDGMTAGRDGVEDDRKGTGLAATLKMTDQLKFEVDYSYLDLSQTPDWGVPWFTEISAPVTEYNGVDRSTFYGLAGRDFQDVTRHVGTMKVTYDISEDAKITNTTRVTKITNDYFLTTPESGVWNKPDDAISARHGRASDPTIDPNDPSTWKTAVGYKSVSAETKVFSNVLETSGKFDEGRFGHTYVVGAGITKEKVENYGAYSAAVSSCIVSAFNPDQLASGCGSALTAPGGTPTLTEVATYSIYALDTVKLSEKWLINGGIRADFYDIERSGLDRSLVAYSLARKDTLVNWNAGITYKPAENLSLYAAVASSMNPSVRKWQQAVAFMAGWIATTNCLDQRKTCHSKQVLNTNLMIIC